MNNPNDFVIKKGVLTEYTGNDEHVEIPEGVTSIGKRVFWKMWGPNNLKSVTIPEGVTSIGDSAFYNCPELETVTIADSVKTIDESAFCHCSNLKNITIPEHLTDIGDIAFRGCEQLADKDGFVVVNNHLFDYFGSASDVTIPDGITHIGSSAFARKECIQSATIPESVVSIGDAAFSSCENLKSVAIKNSAAVLGDLAFRGCEKLADKDGFVIVNNKLFDYCGAASDVVIPEGVTSIGEMTFNSCESMQSVIIPSSVEIIGKDAFDRCNGLTSVVIPEGVTSIKGNAFAGCSNLKYVTIPDSIKSFGSGVFEYTTLSSITTTRNGLKRLAAASLGSGCYFIQIKDGDSVGFYVRCEKSKKNNIAEFVVKGLWDQYDAEILQNGPKYKCNLPVRLIAALGRLVDPVELPEKTKEEMLALLIKNAKKLVAAAEEYECPEIVKQMFAVGVINDANTKAITKLIKESSVEAISCLA